MRFTNSLLMLTISGIVGLGSCFSVFAADGKETNSAESSTVKPATFIKVTFFPEPQEIPSIDQEAGPPTFTGKIWPKMEMKKSQQPGATPLGKKSSYPLRTVVAGVTALDTYVHEGSTTSIAVNWADSNNLIATFNPPLLGSPLVFTFLDLIDDSNRVSSSIDGNQTWTLRQFPHVTTPDMSLILADPWANAGNAA